MVARWATIAAGGLLVTLAIVAGVGSRTSVLRELVIETLADRLDSEVKLESFSVDVFPTVDVRGTGLVVRLSGHDHNTLPPLLSVKSFALKGGLFGLLQRPRTFSEISLEGLEINIPPGGPDFSAHYGRAADNAASAASSSPIRIERLRSSDAILRLIPRRSDKQPREFLIHQLTMEGIGIIERMPFNAELTNPIPRGAITTQGRFGPWSSGEPGATPIEGKYLFDKADLSTIKGIGGILTSTGEFSGPLGRIAVKGETRTPDFRLEVAGNPVPLTTTFEATVDGTDGDTYLNAVNVVLGKTPIASSGVVAGTPGVKGRTVQVKARIADGRIEDLLRLSVKGNDPLLTGDVALQTEMLLPPGAGDVVERLRLKGNFDLSRAQFTGSAVREKLGEMSARASGTPGEVPSQVVSELEGQFAVAGGTLTLTGLRFRIPGATVQLSGTYGLKSEVLDFEGTLRMQATISEAAGGGAKSVFLKLVDPFFKKKGAGAVLPIRVRGTREQPKVGLDVVKALTPK